MIAVFQSNSSLSDFISLIFLLVFLLIFGIVAALSYGIVRLISHFSTLTGLAIGQLTVKILCFAFPLLFFIGLLAFNGGWVRFVLTRYSSVGLTSLWLFPQFFLLALFFCFKAERKRRARLEDDF